MLDNLINIFKTYIKKHNKKNKSHKLLPQTSNVTKYKMLLLDIKKKTIKMRF